MRDNSRMNKSAAAVFVIATIFILLKSMFSKLLYVFRYSTATKDPFGGQVMQPVGRGWEGTEWHSFDLFVR